MTFPLVERVAKALCPWVYGKKRPQPVDFIWTMLIDDQRDAYRKQAQAALDACGAEEMREALELLCEAKDLKETYGDCAAYREVKERGWAKARAVLARLDKPTGEAV
jgi:hypothetical protein